MFDQHYESLPILEFGDPWKQSEPFGDDCFFFLQWALATNWISKLEERRPTSKLDALQMQAAINDAMKLLGYSGIAASHLKSLNDLISLSRFPVIIHQARRSLDVTERLRLVSLLLGIAEDWSQLPSWHVTALYEVAALELTELDRNV